MNYEETLQWIHSLGMFSLPPTLERIRRLLSLLGNPQERFRAVHVAGTNGKGSVSAMLAKIFQNNGQKTGLFISPYILDFCERIQINGTFIPKEDLVRVVERVRMAGVAVTEFELITAAAFLYFAEQGCDTVVAETGLGGRLDATNTFSHPDAAVITRIGLDHTAVLGNTIEKIAWEKCGIIHDCPVITSPNQDEKALKVIRRESEELTVPELGRLQVLKTDVFGNSFLYKGERYDTLLGGEHQVENALIAIETAQRLGISGRTVAEALKTTTFPARMEPISRTPPVILDGAHNPDGAAALAKTLRIYGGNATAIIGVMKDKDYERVLALTLPYCRYAAAVTVRDMPRSLPAEQLCAAAGKFCLCEAFPNYSQAIEKAAETAENDPVFVFGSLYLASGIREPLKDFYKNF